MQQDNIEKLLNLKSKEEIKENLQMIVNFLMEGKREERVLAAQMLGKLEGEDVAEYLIQALNDSYDWVRIRAAQSLKEVLKTVKKPEIYLDLLDRIYQVESDEKVKATLIKTVVTCKEEAIPFLLAALDEASPRLKANALEALMELNVVPEKEKLLPLAASNHRVKAALARLLDKSGDKKLAYKIFTEMKNSQNLIEKATAAYLIGQLGLIEEFDFLVNLLSVAETRKCAVNALIKLGNEIEEKLINYLSEDCDKTDIETLLAAIEVLEKIGGKKSYYFLKKLALMSENGQIRERADEALFYLERD